MTKHKETTKPCSVKLTRCYFSNVKINYFGKPSDIKWNINELAGMQICIAIKGSSCDLNSCGGKSMDTAGDMITYPRGNQGISRFFYCKKTFFGK